MNTPSSKRTGRVTTAIASLVVTGMLILGCASGRESPPAATVSPGEARQAAARQAVFAQIEGRMAVMDVAYAAKTLSEFLPNRLFSFEGRAPAPMAVGLVAGHFTAVSEGRAYVLVGDDADSDTEVPFDTKDPLWRSLDVTLEISQGWGEFTGASTVSFAVAIGGNEDPRTAIDNYSTLGQVIVVLTAPGRYTYDPALYRVASSGTLIGTVGEDDGTISFPAMGEAEQEFLNGTSTLGELDTAAAEDDVVIIVNGSGG